MVVKLHRLVESITGVFQRLKIPCTEQVSFSANKTTREVRSGWTLSYDKPEDKTKARKASRQAKLLETAYCTANLFR
jgi:hypothetical protein